MSKRKNDSAYRLGQSAGCDPPGSDSSPSENSTAARWVWAWREEDLGCWVQPHRHELPALL